MMVLPLIAKTENNPKSEKIAKIYMNFATFKELQEKFLNFKNCSSGI